MTSLIPYHAEVDAWSGAHWTFLFPLPERIKQIMSPRFICILAPRRRSGCDPRIIARYLPGPRPLWNASGCQPCLFPSLLPSPHTGIPLFYTPLLPVPLFWISAREGIQNASAPRSMPRITSRTRTLTAIGDLYFPDPYYLNAGAFVRRMVPRW